jgi:hypothetical protein
VIWYSQQMAIPFWMIGHIHLMLNNYHQLYNLGISLFLHFMVALGFYLDWRDHENNRTN